MEERTNPDAIQYDEWATEFADDAPAWKVRRLAVETTHLADDHYALSR